MWDPGGFTPILLAAAIMMALVGVISGRDL